MGSSRVTDDAIDELELLEKSLFVIHRGVDLGLSGGELHGIKRLKVRFAHFFARAASCCAFAAPAVRFCPGCRSGQYRQSQRAGVQRARVPECSNPSA